MSLSILDTDMLTLFAEGHPVVTRRFFQHRSEDVAITVLSVEEQLSGWYTQVRKAKRQDQLARAYRELARSVRFLSGLQILDYDVSAMQRYDQLRKQKIRIGRTDLRIASVVLEQSAVLVTRNLRDFRRVPGLAVEDWSV